MNPVDEILSKQMKLAARKRLYYSIHVCVEACFHALNEKHQLVQAMAKILDDKLPEGIPEEIKENMPDKSDLVIMQLDSIRPLYTIAHALRSYKAAFGEYPEFSKFIGAGSKANNEGKTQEECLEHFIEKCLGLMEMAESAIKKNGMLKKPGLGSACFGEDFERACSLVKLKGEE